MMMTLLTARVLRALLDDPAAPRYGLDLMRELGIPSGTIFPLLARLEANGLARSELEQIDPHEQERPARRYYTLTGYGETTARAELAALAAQLTPPPGAAA